MQLLSLVSYEIFFYFALVILNCQGLAFFFLTLTDLQFCDLPTESSGNLEQYSSHGMHTFNISPLSQPQRRQACGRTYSRKRLLDQ